MKCTYCNRESTEVNLFRTTPEHFENPNLSCAECINKYRLLVHEAFRNFMDIFNSSLANNHRIDSSSLEPLIEIVNNVNLISDGYHTFDELYEFRKMYNAALFNEWGKQLEFVSAGEGINNLRGVISIPIKYDVHKSWRHYDGELCFGGGWFIVVAMLPTGQISNHYKAEDWDLFKIPEVEKAKYEFDGHTGKDVLERLKQL